MHADQSGNCTLCQLLRWRLSHGTNGPKRLYKAQSVLMWAFRLLSKDSLVAAHAVRLPMSARPYTWAYQFFFTYFQMRISSCNRASSEMLRSPGDRSGKQGRYDPHDPLTIVGQEKARWRLLVVPGGDS